MKDVNPIRQRLLAIADEASDYFAEAAIQAFDRPESGAFKDIFSGSNSFNPNYYWEQLDPALQDKSLKLIDLILDQCSILAERTQTSPLTGSEDTLDVKIAAKAIRSALRLRRYSYHRASVMHDEGSVLGFEPAQQSESYGLLPSDAHSEFLSKASSLYAVLRLVESTAEPRKGEGRTAGEVARYRAGTAFIMMWMDPTNAQLIDVADAVRDVFKQFDIRAVRADDIEHEGLITREVLNEIETSEFLFADLSGMRPNVYYEIGYAHALGKRVILFRKSGTSVHFDLAGYNCPEYENLRDLRMKLTKRMSSITNKQI